MKIGVRDYLVSPTSEQKAYDVTNDRFNVNVQSDVSSRDANGNLNVNINADSFGTLPTAEQRAYDVTNDRFNVNTLSVPKNASLIAADESVAQSLSLDKTGLKHVSILCQVTTATTFTISVSQDNITYYDYAVSGSVTSYTFNEDLAFSYIKVSNAVAGTSGTDTVTFIITSI